MATIILLILSLHLSIGSSYGQQTCASSLLVDGQTNTDINALNTDKGDDATPHNYVLKNGRLVYNATALDQYYYTWIL